MEWENNVKQAYRIGYDMLQKKETKEIFEKNNNMISNLNSLCKSISENASNNRLLSKLMV